MPEGGTLTIQMANATLTRTEAADLHLDPGHYAMMAVDDTGSGISSEVRSQIFEPFFTTKEVGKGTGLGLATVLGIVEQSGGAIRCESEPDRGTSFQIFLPALAMAEGLGAEPAGSVLQVPQGSEVILLVEDADMVRALAREILEMSGYKVHEAGNGREGLQFFQTHQDPVDLLVCDVVMPGLGGREFAERALQLRPGLKVLFVSGHTQDTVLREGVKRGTRFLQKPYTPDALARKVRETLDADSSVPN